MPQNTFRVLKKDENGNWSLVSSGPNTLGQVFDFWSILPAIDLANDIKTKEPKAELIVMHCVNGVESHYMSYPLSGYGRELVKKFI